MAKSSSSIFKVLLLNLLFILAGLVFVELIFGDWFRTRDPLSRIMIRRNFDLKYKINGIYESDLDMIKYTRDSFGFRGKSIFNKPELVDVITVGGSTTDQKYIDDGRTWQEVMEKRFREEGRTIRFANAGVDGQSSTGHIKNFQYWFNKIPNLKPRYIIFYIGINDIYSAHMDHEDKLFLSKWSRFKTLVADHSALYELYRKIRGTRAAIIVEVNHRKKLDSTTLKFNDSTILDPREYELYSQKFIPDFKERVRQLIEHTRAMGAEPIFVTQSTARTKFIDGKLMGVEGSFSLANSDYRMNGLGFYRISNLYADALREVCEGRYAVVDLTKDPIWFNVDFYDWHHNSEVGAEKLGSELYRQLKDRIK
jgi:lysophospholipase L1-like esterase